MDDVRPDRYHDLVLPLSADGFRDILEGLLVPQMSGPSVFDKKMSVLHHEITRKCMNSDGDAKLARQRAFEKSLDSEARCRATNARLSQPTWALRRIIHGVARHVQLILRDDSVSAGHEPCAEGDSPDTLLDFLCWRAAHGSKSTTRLRRKDSDLLNKMRGRPHATHGAQEILDLLRPGFYPRYAVDGCDIVEAGRWDSVPKDASTDRPMMAEPCVNMFFQKAAGAFIRHRMNGIRIWPGQPGWRLNLNDQSVNQMLAKLGSIDGRTATIDLSSASDSISLLLVYLLVPEWLFVVLEKLRTPKVVYPDGSTHTLEMFSSMGNGFTWELQSLLFLAMARYAVEISCPGDGPTATYGDDIIIPSAAAPTLFHILTELGFLPNERKSFSEGFYRESCGKHYFHGFDVTPFYIRKPIEKDADLYRVHNRLLEWMAEDGYLYECLRPLVNGLRRAATRELIVPWSFSDGGFYSDLDPAVVRCTANGLYKSKQLVEKSYTYDANGNPAVLTKALYKAEVQRSSKVDQVYRRGDVPIRKALTGAVMWARSIQAYVPNVDTLTGETSQVVDKFHTISWCGLPPYC